MALREILHTLDMKRLFCHSKWHRFSLLSGEGWLGSYKISPFCNMCAHLCAYAKKCVISPPPPTFPPPWRKAGGGREGESPHHRPSPLPFSRKGRSRRRRRRGLLRWVTLKTEGEGGGRGMQEVRRLVGWLVRARLSSLRSPAGPG